MLNFCFVVIGFIIGVCMCGVIADCKHIDVGNKVVLKDESGNIILVPVDGGDAE